jgi:DNA-binding LacI/PurR family transcriptional regulator
MAVTCLSWAPVVRHLLALGHRRIGYLLVGEEFDWHAG